jgi:hypothetical protein
MLTIKKTLTIKYKLANSVFESLNKLAYNTQSRALGTTKNSVHKILAHPTFCEDILPIIIGNNSKNSEWEHEKLDYISSIQITITNNGYTLELDSIFKKDDPKYKEAIATYITDYKIDPKASEKEIAEHILSNEAIPVIDYHLYFRFTNAKDYLYWVLAVNSPEVANTVEDIEKSPNIRFFFYDEKVAKRRALSNADTQVKAINKLNSLRAQDNGDDLLKDIAILKSVIPFVDIVDMSKEDVYLELFRYVQTSPDEFLTIAEDKDIVVNATIKKYIDSNILSINEEGHIVDSANTNTVVGTDMTASVLYFKNPLNKAELLKFENRYKSLKR